MLGACVLVAAASEADVREADEEEEDDREADADEEEAELADELELELSLALDDAELAELAELAEELAELMLADVEVFGMELVCTSLAPEIWNALEKLMAVGSLVSTMAKFHCPLLTLVGMVNVAVPEDDGTVAALIVSAVRDALWDDLT